MCNFLRDKPDRLFQEIWNTSAVVNKQFWLLYVSYKLLSRSLIYHADYGWEFYKEINTNIKVSLHKIYFIHNDVIKQLFELNRHIISNVAFHQKYREAKSQNSNLNVPVKNNLNVSAKYDNKFKSKVFTIHLQSIETWKHNRHEKQYGKDSCNKTKALA